MKPQTRTKVALAVLAILVGAGFSFSSLAADSNHGTATTPEPKIKMSPPRGEPSSPQVVENEIVVKIKHGLFSSGQDTLQKPSQLENVGNRLAKDLSLAFQTEDNPVEVIALYPALGILSLRLPQNVPMQSAIDYLQRDKQVESVSLNYKGTLHGHNMPPPPAPPLPDDFYWTHDWPTGFAATGLAYLWGLDKIGMKQAWGLLPQWGTPPGSLPIVAVVDTGIDFAHLELRDQMWTPYGVNIIYERSTAVNSVNDCSDIQRKDPMDMDGHGTEVAGTIAAKGNNHQTSDFRTYTVGVTQYARLMAVKITCKHKMDNFESPYLTDAIAGIEYAVRMKASVIIGPWGFTVPVPNSLVDDLRTVIKNGDSTALYVASAGNSDMDIDTGSVPLWPQRFGLQNLIVVAATDPSDMRWVDSPGVLGSNYGASSIDIGAPGADGTTYSVQAGGVSPATTAAAYGGTSAAAPHVAGCAALLQTIRAMTPKDLKGHLIKTGEPKSLPIKPFAGSTKRLDCGNAVSKLLRDVTAPLSPSGLVINPP